MTLFDPDNPELDAAIARHPSNVVHAVFRFAWPNQPCRICLRPLDIAADDTTYEVDSEGRNIGFRHMRCPKEGSQDAEV